MEITKLDKYRHRDITVIHEPVMAHAIAGTITVVKRSSDYMAFLTDDRTVWGRGEFIGDAVDDVLCTIRALATGWAAPAYPRQETA